VHPAPSFAEILCRFEHAKLQLATEHAGQRYFAGTPASHTAQFPMRPFVAGSAAVEGGSPSASPAVAGMSD